MRRTLPWALVALGATLAGCGAKTGLYVPDSGVDAFVPVDAGPPPPPPPICIEAPPEAGAVRVSLSLPASLRVVDVMFLIDSSGSMRDEIDAVRSRLRDSVVPGVRAIIPDAAFGVALFGEFPERPHAAEGADVGPYQLRSPITLEVPRVETALDMVPTWGNLDEPEAAIEGLFQVTTGEGLSPWIDAALGCPGGGTGGACFRRDAFRVVMLVTDAPMHNGPPGIAPIEPYTFTPPPHTYEDAVDAVSRADVTVLGLGASDPFRESPFPHLRALCRDTGSVDGDGNPLVFDIGSGGDRIGTEIVAALRRLAEGVPLDVDASVEDRPGDGVDSLTVIRGIRPLSADPMDAIGGTTDTGFTDVRPGTLLTFEITVDASELPPSTERREFPAQVVFRESGRTRIESRDILVVVPGDDGSGCEELDP